MAADSSGDGAPHEEALGGPAPDAPWEAPTVSVRDAVGADVDAIRDFGHAHIRAHYAPLIGPAAAEAQVTEWWSEHRIRAAVAAGRTVVAHAGGRLVGVGERGVAGADHAIYKLYVHPELRGRAVGPRLIDALTDQLPDGTQRLSVETFAANLRAIAFYRREGFRGERTVRSRSGRAEMNVVWLAREIGPRRGPRPAGGESR